MALRIDVTGQTHELLYLFPMKENGGFLVCFCFSRQVCFVLFLTLGLSIGKTGRS